MINIILTVLFLCITLSVSWTNRPRPQSQVRASSQDTMISQNSPITIQQSVTAGATRAVATGASLSTLLALSALTAPAARADSETQPKKTKKPKVLETPDLGIKYIEITKGSGPFPNPGDFVIISYTAFLSNGTVFDSTEVKGRKPLSFRFGQKQIISGLESVVGEMQPGGQTTCNIPAKYAYGSKGVCIEKDGDKTCLVPPNEDLKYAVKLISLGAGYN